MGTVRNGRTLFRTPIPLKSFHEKAGMSQVCFSLSVFSFLPVDSFRSSRAASVAIRVYHDEPTADNLYAVFVGHDLFTSCRRIPVPASSALPWKPMCTSGSRQRMQ
jgi:hypothetical protein